VPLVRKLLLLFLFFTSSFAIASVHFVPNITTNLHPTQAEKKVFFKEGVLYFEGFQGDGTIEVYSLIGNKVSELKTQELNAFQLNINLQRGNMYVVRILLASSEVYTFKVIAL